MRTEGFRGVLLSVLLVTSLIVPLLSSGLSSNLASASQPSDPPENFIIVVLPDTQYYSQSYPSIFENQTKWIVQNENDKNIVFVTHLGDICQNPDVVSEWQNADNAMSILDNKVPYGILPGNHDMTAGGGVPKYENHFPASRYEGYSYWGGSYNHNKNNYQLFSAGGMDFITLNLEYCPPDHVLDWADNVLDNYPNRSAIISTHAFLNSDNSRYDSCSGNSEGCNGGTSIWDNLVVPHNNVFLVLCGHILGEAKRSDVEDNRTVHQLLSDYQGRSNGGNGWLRIMEFAPNEDKIYVRTYSPYLDQYETDSDSQFELLYPMDWGLAVSTLGAENVGYTSADIRGELENLGGASSAEVWFQWRESGTPTWENTSKENLSSPQEFSESLSGLSMGTTYEFRAVADNSTDVDYGSILTFEMLISLSCWGYRKEITIDHTKVDDNLDNFPVLISIADSDLAAHALDNGDDIVFVNSSEETKLDHEIENFDGENLVAWVRIPSLSASENTIIYMYYGNPSASSQENVEGVWNSDYKMVQHLEETSGTQYDSTNNSNDGTPYGSMNKNVTGKVDGADEFDGVDDYVDCGNDASLDITDAITIEAWAKLDTIGTAADDPYFVSKSDRSASPEEVNYGIVLIGQESNTGYFSFHAKDSGGNWKEFRDNTTLLGINTWYHLVAVYNKDWESGTGGVKLYVDGNFAKSGSLGLSPLLTTTGILRVGAGEAVGGGLGHEVNGTIDEVRISDAARSASWISTTFNNENSPGTFYSIGSEEAIVRGVEVLIEPDNQPGVIGENVVFTVTVKNTGNIWENYKLENNDDAGWTLKLDNDYLEIPENENRETKLTVTIPDNENLVCTTDNITVVATAVDNAEVTDNDNVTVHAVPSWTGTADISLLNLYTLNVEKILDLNLGSKLVVKFYTYGDAFENENVVETFSPPWQVEENESARHPEGVGVKKARLDLTTDDTDNVISTIASFTVLKVDLEVRFTEIPLEWALASPEEKVELEIEFSEIPLYWALAPS